MKLLGDWNWYLPERGSPCASAFAAPARDRIRLPSRLDAGGASEGVLVTTIDGWATPGDCGLEG